MLLKAVGPSPVEFLFASKSNYNQNIFLGLIERQTSRISGRTENWDVADNWVLTHLSAMSTGAPLPDVFPKET